jgi:hypothetical protein
MGSQAEIGPSESLQPAKSRPQVQGCLSFHGFLKLRGRVKTLQRSNSRPQGEGAFLQGY